MKWQNNVEEVANEALAPDRDNDLQGDRLEGDRLYAPPRGDGRTTCSPSRMSFDLGPAARDPHV